MMSLQIDAFNKYELPLKALIGESVAVLGIKGSGKTNTAAVLIEELLTSGLPLTVVDIEGEYWGLKERFEILVAGRSANVDIEVRAEQAAKIAEFSVLHGISVILDMSEFSQEEMMNFLLQYFKSLWATCFHTRKPYEVVLEEAHEFIPQSIRTPLKEVITRIALRGRKRGLGIISVSQRSAKVEKDVLTQAAILFLHRVVHPIDVKVYQDILPLPPRQVETTVGELKPGQAILLRDYQVNVVQIRIRHTFHVGATPELTTSIVPDLRRIDSVLLNELREVISNGNDNEDDATIIRQLQTQLAEKAEEIEQLQALVERLQMQIDFLSKLEVTLTDRPQLSSKLSELKVEHLSAAQLFTQRQNVEQGILAVTDRTRPLDGATLLVPSATETSNSEVVMKQRRRFDSLIQDIQKLPRFHRTILRFLIEREDSAMSVRELARWLDLSIKTIQNKPPLELIKMGLISREGRRGRLQYKSTFHQLLRTQFPDLNEETLTERLLAICQ